MSTLASTLYLVIAKKEGTKNCNFEKIRSVKPRRYTIGIKI